MAHSHDRQLAVRRGHVQPRRHRSRWADGRGVPLPAAAVRRRALARQRFQQGVVREAGRPVRGRYCDLLQRRGGVLRGLERGVGVATRHGRPSELLPQAQRRPCGVEGEVARPAQAQSSPRLEAQAAEGPGACADGANTDGPRRPLCRLRRSPCRHCPPRSRPLSPRNRRRRRVVGRRRRRGVRVVNPGRGRSAQRRRGDQGRVEPRPCEHRQRPDRDPRHRRLGGCHEQRQAEGQGRRERRGGVDRRRPGHDRPGRGARRRGPARTFPMRRPTTRSTAR